MPPNRIPRWVWLVAGALLIAEIAAGIALKVVPWQGAERNVVAQILLGGMAGLIILGLYILHYHPENLARPPATAVLFLVSLGDLGLVLLYFARILPYLKLPYDLACWSEPMFLVDILKWRTGASLYLPPDDSNSNTYTFLAPALTYCLAWLAGKPTSIVFYRVVQQVFLIMASLVATAATRQLLRLVAPQRFGKLSREWFLLFVAASFLLATNQRTNTFNIFLHNDPLALLASCVAFWLMVKHATSQDDHWLWVATLVPSLGFLVKQSLAVWAVAYPVYLWLSGRHTLRRVLLFSTAVLGLLVLTIAACRVYWGLPFWYWTFEVLGSTRVLFTSIADLFAEASWCIGLGLVGLWVLLRERPTGPLWGIGAAWVLVVIGGVYTSGIAYHPSHLGSATVVGGCFALAALWLHWPTGANESRDLAKQWLHLACMILLLVIIAAGLGFTARPVWTVTPDLHRYVADIEREFEGLPPEKVLLDLGEWNYLRNNLLMKDRAVILLTHRKPHYGIIERVRRQEYAKLLLHRWETERILYDLGVGRGLEREIRTYYREVRRIPEAKGMRSWQYEWMTLSEIIVMEPIAPSTEKVPEPR